MGLYGFHEVPLPFCQRFGKVHRLVQGFRSIECKFDRRNLNSLEYRSSNAVADRDLICKLLALYLCPNEYIILTW